VSRPQLPAPNERVELVCDGVSRRAWVVPVADGPLGTFELAVAAPAGTRLRRPDECWAVYPSDDGAAWVCAVEVLEVDGTRLLARLAPARRLQRRNHARLTVDWEAAFALLLDDGALVDDDDRSSLERAGLVPAEPIGRGHLRLVGTPEPAAPAAAGVRWVAATCVDLSAGGARLRVHGRATGQRGQRASTRVAIPDLGNPVLPSEVVEVAPTRSGTTIVRVRFDLPSPRMVDELAALVVRAQLAERAVRP
jgi:hypothetical protein